MPLINPLIAGQTRPQRVLWRYIKCKVQYELELVLPSKAIINEYTGNIKAYLLIVTIPIKEQDLTYGKIVPGDKLVIDFPLRTFESAWNRVSYTFRKQFNEECNLKIIMVKKNRQHMDFLHCEKLTPTDEQKVSADEVYDNPGDYTFKIDDKRTNVREEETH